MKKILCFNGSPRKNGNTSHLLKSFVLGVDESTALCEVIDVSEKNIKYCTGCLRCNVLGYCSLRDDDWKEISKKIDESDVLVFATPVYFHHVSAQLKTLLDRFRSFIKIKITEDGLEHTPRKIWNKDIVLLLVMGSSDDVDADPIIDLFNFMIEIMGPDSRLHVLKGTRLAVTMQVAMNAENLKKLYEKLGLEISLAENDAETNKQLLKSAYNLAQKLSMS